MKKKLCIICNRKYSPSLENYKRQQSCSKKCGYKIISKKLLNNRNGKGMIPWNKGLTKEVDKRLKSISNCNISRKGKHHSKENLEKLRERMKGNKINKGRTPWNYIDGRSKIITTARYGDDWDKIRCLVYLRDKFMCQECGINMNETKKRHHVHHKIPFLISFDNSLSNLITLCSSCHKKEDARIMKELKNKKNKGVIFGNNI